MLMNENCLCVLVYQDSKGLGLGLGLGCWSWSRPCWSYIGLFPVLGLGLPGLGLVLVLDSLVLITSLV